MTIKSIYKNKGSRQEVANRRGIFLTSVLSKVVEKIVLNKVEGEMKISAYQSGGKKRMSTCDNWITLMAVMDNNRRLKRNTYIILAGAEKCFDKLWLDDCPINLKNAGMREKEISLIYEMNKKAKIEIETPTGKTEEIEVTEIVKQGTAFGTILCCVNSEKVNEVNEKALYN